MKKSTGSKNTIQQNCSDKLTFIDQITFEKLQQSSSTERKIKNVKFKKSQQLYNLCHYIQLKKKFKKKVKRPNCTIYKQKTSLLRKHKYRHSRLKKRILKNRLLKKNRIKELKNQDIKDEESPITEDVTEDMKDLKLNTGAVLHSNRFRDYCDNMTSQELCDLVTALLRDLNRFQKRAVKNNAYKARGRRRFVIGFREVQSQLKINKIKLVIMATDCERCSIEGGLDSTISCIKEECNSKNIPYAFALQRRQLSYTLFKKSSISCIGILDYDGVQDTFFKLLNILEGEKNKYKGLSDQKETSSNK